MIENITQPGNKGSLEEIYNNNLEEAIKLASEYNLFIETGTDFKNIEEKERYKEERAKRNRAINKAISERAKILHEQGIKSVDQLPESKFTDEEIQIYQERKAHWEGNHEPRYEELKKAEVKADAYFWKVFQLAKEELAGSEVKVASVDGDILEIKKGDLKFEVPLYLSKYENGVGKNSRIFQLDVTKETKGDVCSYKNVDVNANEWAKACEDPQIQKDLDKIIAVLG